MPRRRLVLILSIPLKPNITSSSSPFLAQVEQCRLIQKKGTLLWNVTARISSPFMPKFFFQQTERQTFSMERQTEASYPARDLKPLLRILTWWQARFFLTMPPVRTFWQAVFRSGGGVDSLSLDGYTDNVECGLIYRLRYYLLVNRFCRSVRAWLSDRYKRTFLTLQFWPSCFWGVRA